MNQYSDKIIMSKHIDGLSSGRVYCKELWILLVILFRAYNILKEQLKRTV